jgi:hypothetical protein
VWSRSTASARTGSGGVSGDVATYDLRIASTEDVLPSEASASADTLRPTAVGPAADIVP